MTRPASREPLLIVGVGASAGGLEAFTKLLEEVPGDSPLTFVLVQHLGADQPSYLADVLTARIELPVLLASEGQPIEGGRVYTVPPGFDLSVRNGRLRLSPPLHWRGVRWPIDHLFRSLAGEFGAHTAGVVLSGAGNDGTAGLRALRAAGALTIAEDPQEAAYGTMPASAVDAGVTQLVLAAAEIPAALLRYAEEAGSAQGQASPGAEADAEQAPSDEDLGRLADVLSQWGDLDLRKYKACTLRRRVLRRMGLRDVARFSDYLEHVSQDPTEAQQLLRDVLISVTEFFRDPDAFEALERDAALPLLQTLAPDEPLRVWVPGCATGEEAYSLAILLNERAAELGRPLDLRLFATDIDPDALSFARAGLYPPAIADRLPPARLERNFVPAGSLGFQIADPLRDQVSFAIHDLTRDPPFARLHLVSCRNVLIYLRPDVQHEVLERFHFALRPGGVLFLGSSEALSAGARALFAVVSPRARIFRRLGDESEQPPARRGRSVTRLPERLRGTARIRASHGLEDAAREALLRTQLPPTLVIGPDDHVLYVHGEPTPWVRLPQGAPKHDLFALLREELRPRVRSAVIRCRRELRPVELPLPPMEQGDGGTHAQLRVLPAHSEALGPGALVLSFLPQPTSPEPRDGQPSASNAPQDKDLTRAPHDLEQELRATREDLRTTVAELERSNAELREAHDDSLAMGEELQSVNEELEASSEELRLLNEELTTVNAQLKAKLGELQRANDDLENLVTSAQVATLFLDPELTLKQATPAAARLLRLGPADKGRSLDTFSSELLQADLVQEAQGVLNELSPARRELRAGDGCWYLRRALPYRTQNRQVDGVVVTFVDVTQLKHVSDRLLHREQQQAVVARLGLRALTDADLQGLFDQAVREVQRTLVTDYCKVLELLPGGQELLLRAGVGWREGLVGEARVDTGLESQAGYTLSVPDPVLVEDLSQERRFSGPALLHEHEVLSGVSCVIPGSEGPFGVLGAHSRERRTFGPDDANFLVAVAHLLGAAVTRRAAMERLRAREDELRRSERRLARTLETAQVGVAFGLPDGRILEANDALLALLGISRDDLRTRPIKWQASRPPELALDDERSMAALARDGRVGPVEGEVVRPDGERVPVLTSAAVLDPETGEHVVFMVDLTEAKAVERALRAEEARARAQALELQSLLDTVPLGIAVLDRDLRYRRINQHMARFSALPADELLGRPLDEALPTLGPRLRPALLDVLATAEASLELEVTGAAPDARGAVTWLTSQSPICDAEGRAEGVLCVIQDVTERKRFEQELEEASAHKDMMLATLGHELRNPLAALRAAVELQGRLAPDDARFPRTREVIERQTRHMTRLMDDLLDLARIARGGFALARERLDLRDPVAEVLEHQRDPLVRRGLKLMSKLPERPVLVSADRGRVVQAIENLLSNAVKFTAPPGVITVQLEAEQGHALLSIRDTGVGIEPELLSQLFEPFRQAPQELSRPAGGLGLGLSLVKRLIDLHGGTIEARSAGRGTGAEFRVRLPLLPEEAAPEPAPAAPAAPEAAPSDRSLRVLVVEDHPDAAEAMAALLSLGGHTVSVAGDARQALSEAKALRPQVVLCDVGLPGERSGYDVARALRADPDLRQALLVALTGYGRPEDRERALSAGFDLHLIKPIGMQELEEILTRARPTPNGGPRSREGNGGNGGAA